MEPTANPTAPEADVAPSELHHDVTAGRVRMRIAEWPCLDPSANELPVLILPGLLAPRTSFRPLARYLQQHFRVIAVDLPGAGESEKPSPSRYPYSIDAFAQDVGDLFGGLGLSRAHVLGHGLGGAVALHLAARHHEFVARLCLVAPLSHSPPRAATSRLVLAPLVGGLLFRQLIGRRTFGRIYERRINRMVSSELLDEYYQSLDSPASRSALLATLRSSIDTRGVVANSRRVRSPTLLVWGQNDQMSPVAQGRRLSREMPQAGLELLETGHAPHEEAPERIAPILTRFFSGKRAGLS